MEVNLAYCQMSGYSEQELLALTIPDLEAAESPVETEAHLVKIKRLGKDRFESRHRRKDGAIFDVEISVQCNYGNDDEMVVFIRDVTERKRAEELLRRSQAELKAITDHAPATVALVDLDAKLRYINHAPEGMRAADLIGLSIFDTATSGFEAVVRAAHEKVCVTQEPETFRVEFPVGNPPDGNHNILEAHTGPVFVDGDMVGVVHVAVDVTEQTALAEELQSQFNELKQAEAALRESEWQLNNAQRIAHIGSWSLDLTANVMMWSEELYRMSGLDPSLPAPVVDESEKLLTPESLTRLSTNLNHAVETGVPYELELEMVSIYGRRGWVWARGEPIKDESGNVTVVRGTAQDITDRKLTEIALQSNRDQLKQLNQELEMRVRQRTEELQASNQELEAFNYSVSHDLRAPLRHVAGFIELLKRQGYDGADQKSQHYMDVISASAVQMGNMVDDILTFSRLGRIEMRMGHVNLDALVKATLTVLQSEMKERDIRWNISPLPSVEGEREMLQRVMTNLIGNALKYSRNKPVAVIEVSVKTQGDEHIFCVKDNGVGFDMRYVDKLFGVFQRLHRAEEFEGTGIGLANVQRIIQRHGGRVWAEGELGEGASIYFSLKIASP